MLTTAVSYSLQEKGVERSYSVLSVVQVVWHLSVARALPAEFLPEGEWGEESEHQDEMNGARPLVSNKELLPCNFTLDNFSFTSFTGLFALGWDHASPRATFGSSWQDL